jgi:hypothetical protein
MCKLYSDVRLCRKMSRGAGKSSRRAGRDLHTLIRVKHDALFAGRHYSMASELYM